MLSSVYILLSFFFFFLIFFGQDVYIKLLDSTFSLLLNLSTDYGCFPSADGLEEVMFGRLLT